VFQLDSSDGPYGISFAIEVPAASDEAWLAVSIHIKGTVTAASVFIDNMINSLSYVDGDIDADQAGFSLEVAIEEVTEATTEEAWTKVTAYVQHPTVSGQAGVIAFESFVGAGSNATIDGFFAEVVVEAPSEVV
jgi:hypothetical protein